VRAVLTTPLGPRFDHVTLASISRRDRLDELDFDLPLAGGYAAGSATVDLHRIADALDAHVSRSPLPLADFAQRLRERPAVGVRGFLTGSIDLVARVDGRYLLADYKSNWLGPVDGAGVDDYHPDRLAEAMLHGDYLLQASLYLVALHRFLRSRLPGYDYDRDVSGFAYLFLRGMIGPGTPCAPDGTPHGVFAGKPPRELVEDLDAVLRGAR
jgi:exodeoxyribonuclease V beta subunit